uniref:Transcription factor IIIB 50 kDa subunit n=1 Tax=Ficedula albicollis TaxID=59894 RepID=A0A803W2J0_FICAL
MAARGRCPECGSGSLVEDAHYAQQQLVCAACGCVLSEGLLTTTYSDEEHLREVAYSQSTGQKEQLSRCLQRASGCSSPRPTSLQRSWRTRSSCWPGPWPLWSWPARRGWGRAGTPPPPPPSQTWLVTGRHPVPIVTAAAFLAWQSLRPGPRLSCPLARFCRLAGVDLPPPAHLRLKELLEILLGMASQLSWLRGFALDRKAVVKHIGDLLQHRVLLLKNAFSQLGEEQQDTAPGQGCPSQGSVGSGSPGKDCLDKDSPDKESSCQDSLGPSSLNKGSSGKDSLDEDSPGQGSVGLSSLNKDSPDKDSPDKASPDKGSSSQDSVGLISLDKASPASPDKGSSSQDSVGSGSPGKGSPSSPPGAQQQGRPWAGPGRCGGTLRPLLPPCLLHPRKRLRSAAPSAAAAAATGDEPISDSEIEQYLRSPEEIRALSKARACL